MCRLCLVSFHIFNQNRLHCELRCLTENLRFPSIFFNCFFFSQVYWTLFLKNFSFLLLSRNKITTFGFLKNNSIIFEVLFYKKLFKKQIIIYSMYLSLDLLDFFVEFQKLKEYPNKKKYWKLLFNIKTI